MTTNMALQTTYSSAPPIAYAGQLEGINADTVAMVNATSATSIPFGAAIKYKGTPTTDKDADVINGSTDQVQGIVVHSHDYARVWTDSDGNTHGDLDATGLVPGVWMTVLRRGKIAVLVHSTTAVGDNLHVCHTAGTTYTVAGQMGGAAEAAKSLKCTGAQFTSSGASGAFCWLDCIFPSGTCTADT